MGECLRCGIPFLSKAATEKWLEEKKQLICADCNRSRVKQIKYRKGVDEFVCRPWHGDFDAEDYPIDAKGMRFTGELALCGHRDCIAFEHRPDMAAPRKNRVHKPLKGRSLPAMELFIAVAEARGQL